MSNIHQAGEFCWNELATPDIDAAKKFYESCFGWTFTDHQVDGDTYSMVRCSNNEFAGIWQIPHDKQHKIPPHWMSYILVKDLEQSLEKVLKQGASIKVPITKTGDFGLFAIIIDPTGAYVGLWQSTKK